MTIPGNKLTGIWAILILAAILRLFSWSCDPQGKPTEDSSQYNRLATNFVHHGVYSLHEEAPFHPTARRPPVYPVFLAAIYSLTGLFGLLNSHRIAELVQILIGVVSIWMTWQIARKLVGETSGLISAALFAIAPSAIGMSSLIMTESLFTFVLLGTIMAGLSWVEGSSRVGPILAGLGWGLMTLMKPESALLPVLMLLPITLRKGISRQHLVSIVLSLGACSLLVLPWVVRNGQVIGKYGLQVRSEQDDPAVWGGQSMSRDYRLAAENGFIFPPDRFKYLYGADWEKRDQEYQLALKKEVQDPTLSDSQFFLRNPSILAAHCLLRLTSLFRPSAWSEMMGLSEDFGEYKEKKAWIQLGLKGGMLLLDGALLLMALIGFARGLHPQNRRIWLVLSVFAYFVAVYGLVHAIPRYRMPLVPLLSIMASHPFWRVQRDS